MSDYLPRKDGGEDVDEGTGTEGRSRQDGMGGRGRGAKGMEAGEIGQIYEHRE